MNEFILFFSKLAELDDMSGNLVQTHILDFCTLQIQYHIWAVLNFFLRSIFSILQILFYNFVPTHLQKEKENIPLKVTELPQVTLYVITYYLVGDNMTKRINITFILIHIALYVW